MKALKSILVFRKRANIPNSEPSKQRYDTSYLGIEQRFDWFVSQILEFHSKSQSNVY